MAINRKGEKELQRMLNGAMPRGVKGAIGGSPEVNAALRASRDA